MVEDSVVVVVVAVVVVVVGWVTTTLEGVAARSRSQGGRALTVVGWAFLTAWQV